MKLTPKLNESEERYQFLISLLLLLLPVSDFPRLEIMCEK